jgi:hypothetical protein
MLPLTVFRLPLMLANRARTWFVGIVILGSSTNTVYLYVSAIVVFGTVVNEWRRCRREAVQSLALYCLTQYVMCRSSSVGSPTTPSRTGTGTRKGLWHPAP